MLFFTEFYAIIYMNVYKFNHFNLIYLKKVHSYDLFSYIIEFVKFKYKEEAVCL